MMSICQWGKNCKQRFAYSSSSSVSRFNFSARIHYVLIKDLIKSFNIKILPEKFEKCGM